MKQETAPGAGTQARILARLLSDSRVHDCLWVGLMEWDLRIEKVALRPRFPAEGGTHPDGWVLCVGLGPGVRLEALSEGEGEEVGEVRLVVAREAATGLLKRTWGRPNGRTVIREAGSCIAGG